MFNIITNNLNLILAFVAGGAVEYFVPLAIARIKTMHPGKTLVQDLESKIEAIVDAKLAAKAAAPVVAANSNT